MLWKLLYFILTVLFNRWFSPFSSVEWIPLETEHPHFRRYSPRYRRKRSLVKNLWLVAGCIILAFPFLPVLVFIFLFTTFISFSLLDETE